MLLNCGVGEDSRIPWTTRRSNQSIWKEISPEYSLEGLMLKLKLQYFSHLTRRANSFEKTLMPGKISCWADKGATEDEMVEWHHWLNGHEFEPAPGDSEGQGSLASCSPWVSKSQTRLKRLSTYILSWVSDAIQPSHPLSSLYPLPFNLSQPWGLF